MVLVDAIVLREGVREGTLLSEPEGKTSEGMKSLNESMLNPSLQGESWYLMYPGSGAWRVFPSSGLDAGRMWTASENAVWWVAGRPPHPSAGTIRAVHAHDPTPVVEAQEAEPVTWLAFDAPSASLLWASGATLRAKAEAGGPPRIVMSAGAPIAQVLPAGPGAYAVCTRDSLHIVDGLGAGTATALRGLTPDHAYRAPGGQVWLAADGGGGHPPALARVDSASRVLVPVDVPPVRNARWVATPGSSHLILYVPGRKVPGTVQVYEVASGRWTEAANPGINGWEEIPAR
jgi:hypothetical protein